MKQYSFDLYISYDQFMSVYQGHARHIVIHSEQGVSIQLPAQNFLPFVSQLGVRGYFRLTTDDHNKFIKLEQLHT